MILYKFYWITSPILKGGQNSLTECLDLDGVAESIWNGLNHLAPGKKSQGGKDLSAFQMAFEMIFNWFSMNQKVVRVRKANSNLGISPYQDRFLPHIPLFRIVRLVWLESLDFG